LEEKLKIKPHVRLMCPLCNSTLSQTYKTNSRITIVATECCNPQCNYKLLLTMPTVVLIREAPSVFREVTKRGALVVITSSPNWRCSFDSP